MKSMTGMGKAKGVIQDTHVRVEIKSVNHRYCDVHFRAPNRYAPLEIPVQQFIRSQVGRGRVEVFLFEEKSPKVSQAELSAFKGYFSYLYKIKKELKLAEDISLQHLLSGVGGWTYKEIDNTKTWNELKNLLTKAIKDLNTMKEQEGKALKKEMKERVLTIEKIKGKIQSQLADIRLEIEEKLNLRIKERLLEIAELDPQRLSSEVIYYLDRTDVSEELQRLDSHIEQMNAFFDVKEGIGRKIDFLLQEFNREFNTIASKVQKASVAHLVVEAKLEIEKIREQIQNIE